MKLSGFILFALFLGVSMGFEDYCPMGSRMFLVDPNEDGSCPESLPASGENQDETCDQVS